MFNLSKLIKYIDERIKNKRLKVSIPFILSLLFHFLFLFVTLERPTYVKKVFKKPERIKIVLRKESDAKKKQVVNSEESKLKAIPEDSKYLGKKSQLHDRQTKAKIVDSFNEGGKGVESSSSSKATKKLKQKSQTTKKITKKAKSKFPKLSDLNVAKDLSMEQFSPPKGHKFGNEQKKGLSKNNDYLEDVPLGEFTKLNTTEFKFYGFYYRIRQQLEQHWGSLLREKAKILYKKNRKIASDSKITQLKVTLDSKGNIVAVLLQNTSGVQELDDAAIESFNKAGPFPNPPQGMLVDGKATIEWGFVVKG